MEQYLTFLRTILEEGEEKSDRTGTGTMSIFGHQMRFNLADSFPAITTKKIHWPSVIHELLWILSGDTNISYLQENGVKIWNEWADSDGNLGPVYGEQWRKWKSDDGAPIDQIKDAINMINENPDSRRIIVSAWNVGELDKMALMPCHAFFQFYVNDGKLSCQLYQRSADAFLGVPFNISSYSLLTCMVAQICNLKPGEFIWTGGDCHLYLNHIEQAKLQINREPFPQPRLKLNEEIVNIDDFSFEDIKIVDYHHHPSISAPISI
ncbi:MAG: thymidylate synthase [Euryarchaeota archaeon]|jgi:thymidylate synthase|nr:thymidylate synthase [Euryarchaeota archaeon]MBT4391116.1 thymidylate synthase [Euryarchaeota archaeon]MBT4802695.1 thymidylate synthase [Euryarchaeota archaeon]MBT5614289.1 thymidylate synthase [Euryarchaeota archaeon]MBT6683637.1 thymidylate synthase [Euryarchaeota archaeon]